MEGLGASSRLWATWISSALRTCRCLQTGESARRCRLAAPALLVNSSTGSQGFSSPSQKPVWAKETRRIASDSEEQATYPGAATTGLRTGECLSLNPARDHHIGWGHAHSKEAEKADWGAAETEETASTARTGELSQGEGSATGPGMVERLPLLGLSPQDLTPVPSVAGQCFSVNTTGVEFASRAVAWASQNYKHSNLGISLEKEWVQRHCPVMHHEAPALHEKPLPKKPCLEAGVCVCSAEGKKVARFRSQLIRSMKATFKDKPLRDKLAQGDIVIHLHAALEEPDPQQRDSLAFWFHIGAMYFSPYRPTLHRLLPSSSSSDNGAQLSLDAALLLVTPPFSGPQVQLLKHVLLATKAKLLRPSLG